jgi:hypothetical protein
MRLPLLVLHVGAGILAMLAGALAIVFRKGSQGHRRAGNVFVICMLIVSAIGSYLGFVKGEMDNFTGGTFAFYLVATAWATATREQNSEARLECPSPCVGLRGYQLCLGCGGGAWPDGRKGSKSRRSVLFLRDSGPAERGWGRPHAAARWDFWHATSRSTSVAYVLWVVYRYNFLLPRSAAGISRMVAGIIRSCGISFSAVAIPDLLVYPSSPDKHVPKSVGGSWLGTITARARKSH